MVGGRVKERITLPDRVWVNVKETSYLDECALYLERNSDSLAIEPCDFLWWQSRSALWTPLDDSGRRDVVIPRIGYSGALRPEGY